VQCINSRLIRINEHGSSRGCFCFFIHVVQCVSGVPRVRGSSGDITGCCWWSSSSDSNRRLCLSPLLSLRSIFGRAGPFLVIGKSEASHVSIFLVEQTTCVAQNGVIGAFSEYRGVSPAACTCMCGNMEGVGESALVKICHCVQRGTLPGPDRPTDKSKNS